MQFPKDHYAHSDCKSEWWYFAGIGDLDGLGSINYHVSFFRKFSSTLKESICFAHFGVNKNGKFEFKQKTSDKDLFSESSLEIAVDGWNLNRWGKRMVTLLDEGTSLVHIPRKKPAVNRDGYYSITDLGINGSIGGEIFKGRGWFDHEFSNASTIESLMYDYKWFALQLDKGIEAMIHLFPKQSAKSSGTIVFPSGESKTILPGDYCLKPGATNFGWILELPDYGMEFSLEKQSEAKITHALGPDYIEGTFNVVSRKKIGQGFYEITGGEL